MWVLLILATDKNMVDRHDFMSIKPKLHYQAGAPMITVIAFPSASGRGQLAVERALAAFDIKSGAGIEEMMRLALEHAESEVRERASRWLAEVLNVRVAQ